MPPRRQHPVERVAWALCRINKVPPNSSFNGAPMWQSFTSKAEHIPEALQIRQLIDFIAEVTADTSISDAERTKARTALTAYVGTG